MSAARACALAALAAAAAYWGSLDNGFTWDDHVHIEAAPFVQDASNARVLLTPGFWKGTTEVEGSARPLLLASLLADRALWGAEPEGYHLTSMLLHAACAAALAWLAWLLLGSPLVAALAGTLFALHPVQTEAVCEITFRADLLAALGVLLALAALRLACARRSYAWAAASAAAFALALLAKESAVAFPALALLMEALFPSGRGAARVRRAATVLIAATLAAYGAFRIPRGGYGEPSSAASDGKKVPPATAAAAAKPAARTQYNETAPEWTAPSRDPATRLRTMSGILGDYARLVLWPAGLQADRSAPTVASWSSPRAWSGWAVLLLILGLAWSARAALPGAAFGLCWFLVALAPVSDVVALPNLIAERYLYLAVAGAALAAAAALDAAARRCPRPRLVFLAASAVLLSTAAAATRTRVPAWHDDASLFGSPPVTESARLHYNRGLARNDGRLDDAEAEYRRALALNPRSVETLVNLADVAWLRGDLPGRIALLRRAVAAAPDSAIAYEALGDALDAAGRRNEALEAFRKAVGADGSRPSARRAYAADLERARRYGEALKEEKAAAELAPKSAATLAELGRAAQEAGRFGDAAAAYRAAVRLDPKDGLAWANLGACLRDPAEALVPLQRAVALLPDNPGVRLDLGVALEALGRLPEAEAAYRSAALLNPRSAAAWHDDGVVLQKQGNLERADAAYQNALRSEPDKVESLTNLAELRAGVGAVDEAFPLIARARALRPGDPVVRAAYDDIVRRRAAGSE